MKPAGLVVGLSALLATAVAISGDGAATFETAIAKNRQALHVLNRMAFGPRPGDVKAVEKMGVKAWIRQQLDPATLPENPLLESRIQQLATMALPTWQLVENFQTPPIQIMNLGISSITQILPGDKLSKVISSSTPVEERTAIIKALNSEQRSQVLAQLPQQIADATPEFKQEAAMARQARQDMTNRQLTEQQRRLRPPLSELFTPDELNILKHGTDEEKTALLAPLNAEKRAQAFRSMGEQGAQLLPAAWRRQAMLTVNFQQGAVNEVIESKLQRAVLSTHQLEEVLVDFWFNHFNVSVTKAQIRVLLPSYERDAIRPHVLGRFRDMLLATARHPAMLFYLDNYQSQAPSAQQLQLAAAGNTIRLPGINENYGRELMELHTLGVGGGYTQQDVINVARVFTGWTIFDVTRIGEFQFDPTKHDRNEKTVLGHKFGRAGGENEGVQVIDILARHPSTARFISRKLAQRFVADDPPPALVERMAATFTKTDGDLRAVMETLLLSKEFLSEGAWRSKVKSPFELVASSLRALDADLTDTTAVAQRIADMGQPLYAKAEPTGYPNTGESWSSSAGLLGRMNYATALTAGQIAGIKVSPDAVAASGLRRAMFEITGAEASGEVLAGLEQIAAGNAPTPALVAAVLIGSPEFQRK